MPGALIAHRAVSTLRNRLARVNRVRSNRSAAEILGTAPDPGAGAPPASTRGGLAVPFAGGAPGSPPRVPPCPPNVPKDAPFPERAVGIDARPRVARREKTPLWIMYEARVAGIGRWRPGLGRPARTVPAGLALVSGGPPKSRPGRAGGKAEDRASTGYESGGVRRGRSPVRRNRGKVVRSPGPGTPRTPMGGRSRDAVWYPRSAEGAHRRGGCGPSAQRGRAKASSGTSAWASGFQPWP